MLQPRTTRTISINCLTQMFTPHSTVLCLVTQSFFTLQPHRLWPTRLLCPWGFSRPEYWSGLSHPPPGDLPNPGMEPRSPALLADSLPSEPPEKPHLTKADVKATLPEVTLFSQMPSIL